MRSLTMGAFHLFRMGIEQPTCHLSFCRLWLRVVHVITTATSKRSLRKNRQDVLLYSSVVQAVR